MDLIIKKWRDLEVPLDVPKIKNFNCSQCGTKTNVDRRFKTVDELIKKGLDPAKIDRSRPDLTGKIACYHCAQSFNQKGVSLYTIWVVIRLRRIFLSRHVEMAFWLA